MYVNFCFYIHLFFFCSKLWSAFPSQDLCMFYNLCMKCSFPSVWEDGLMLIAQLFQLRCLRFRVLLQWVCRRKVLEKNWAQLHLRGGWSFIGRAELKQKGTRRIVKGRMKRNHEVYGEIGNVKAILGPQLGTGGSLAEVHCGSKEFM